MIELSEKPVIMRNYIILLLISLITSCGENKEVQGSCRAEIENDHSSVCLEFHSDKDLKMWKGACKGVMRGQWSESACDTTGALGGCVPSHRHSILWIYPAGKYQTVEDVEEFCDKKTEEFVLPD